MSSFSAIINSSNSILKKKNQPSQFVPIQLVKIFQSPNMAGQALSNIIVSPPPSANYGKVIKLFLEIGYHFSSTSPRLNSLAYTPFLRKLSHPQSFPAVRQTN